MFENLFNLVKENAGSAIINNAAIPNERNDEAITDTTHSIMNSLTAQMTSGNMNSVLSMFQNGGATTSNSVVNTVSNAATSDMMKKFGLDQNVASGITASLIPQVLNQLVSKTKDVNDSSFDMKSILGVIGGGSGGSMLGGLSDFMK